MLASRLLARRAPLCGQAHRFVSSVGVIGAGQMGTGIAFVTARTAGLPVTIVDSSDVQLEKSVNFLSTSASPRLVPLVFFWCCRWHACVVSARS